MISSQVNHESEASWSPPTADHTPVPMLHGGKTCPPDIDSATLIRWFMTARPQTSQLPTIRLAATTSPMPMVIRRTCLRLNGLHAYADRRIWTVLEAKLTHLRATGARPAAAKSESEPNFGRDTHFSRLA